MPTNAHLLCPANTLLLCTSYLSCSSPIVRVVDIFKDADWLLLWSSDLLAGWLIRSAPVACVCVAPAICVSSSWTTMYAGVCVCVYVAPRCHFLWSRLQLPRLCSKAITCVSVWMCAFLASAPWSHVSRSCDGARLSRRLFPASRPHSVNLSTLRNIPTVA